MDNTETNKITINPKFDLDKDVIRTWLDIIPKINQSKEQDVEKVLKIIEEKLTIIAISELFSKEVLDENESHFLTSFCPSLIRRISNENVTNSYLKSILRNILNLFTNEFIKNFENVNCFPIWEALVETFREEKLFNRSYDDSSDKFLELNYEIFNPNSYTWKSQLKPDDEIDYLLRDLEEKFNKDRVGVANWTRAKIIDIESNKNAKIKLLGTGQIEFVSLISADVLPVKTLSSDYEFREQLKKGDEIDYLDSKSWYRSTVIDVEERYRGGNKYKFIKYGLRIYRQNGKLKDSRGNYYYGWNENFDKEVNVHDPRIRKPNQHAKIIENYGIITTYPLDSKNFNDLETFLPFEINGTKFFAIPKKNEQRKLDMGYLDGINYFFRNEGGEKLINLIKNKEKITLDLFSLLIDYIENIYSFLHYHFARYYLKEFGKKCFDFLLDFGSSDARNFKKEKIDVILRKLRNILLKVYTETDVNAFFDVFTIDFGINCLSSINLEKKLIGLKILSTSLLETIRINSNQVMVSTFNDKHVSSHDLLSKLREKNIIDQIFGSSTHVQIIQKSNDLFKCFLMGNFLSPSDLLKIYGLSNSSDIEMRNSIYKLLQSNFYYFSTNLAEFLILKVLENKTESITTLELDLIGQIYRALSNEKQIEISQKISDSYLNLIFFGKMDTEKTDNLINELINLLKNYEMRELRIQVLKYILTILNDGTHIVKVLKIIRRLIGSVNLMVEEIQKNRIIRLIMEEYTIVTQIIKNLMNYHKYHIEKLQEINKNKDFQIDFFSETYSHRDLVIEVFSFLSVIINNYQNHVFSNHTIDSLYHIFVEKPVNNKDSNSFFKWLKEADEKKHLPKDCYQNIFSKMVKSESLEFSNINLDLFETIWNIFLTINRNLNYIINDKSEASYPSTNDKYNDIRLTCHPLSLDGFDLIWKLILCSPSGDVGKKAIQNFTKLFLASNLGPEERGEIWNSLIQKCIEAIKVLRTLKNSNEKDMKILNILLILQGLIEETEKKGTAGVISHSSILKNKIFVLNIVNEIRTKLISHEMESNFVLTVYGNVTVWDLKILLGKRLKILPELIKLTIGGSDSASANNNNHCQQNHNNYKVLTESDHGKTLNELKIRNHEKITLHKSDVIENIPKVNLSSNGNLTEKVQTAFKEIFDSYSENGKMNKQECAKFATRATGSTHMIPITDNKVTSMFLMYDPNKDDYIEFEGFLKFFKDALDKNKSSVVWDNLSCFNYRNDLKKIMEPIDDYNSNKEIMPRYVIAKNQEYFEEIFSLQDESNLTAKESSKFLSHICTNPSIYRNILSLGNVTGSNKVCNTDVWEEYLNTNNHYKLLYSLEIVESFFEEFELGSVRVDCEPIEASILEKDDSNIYLSSTNRLTWIEIFLSRGGLLHILKVINNPDMTNKLIKKCIVLAIKIIRNCLTILFRAKNDDKKQNTIIILRKESSNFNLEDLIEVEKKNEIDSKQVIENIVPNKYTNELEDELIQMINMKYGNSLIYQINFELVCSKLMEMIYEICQNPNSDEEDRLFVHSSFNLLSLIIISSEDSSHLLKYFFSTNLFNNTVPFEEFILSGCLYSQNIYIINNFCKNLRSLIINLNKYGETSFMIYLLNLFKEKCLTYSFLQNIKERSNFFNIFVFLISNTISEIATNKSIDYQELCIRLVDLLNNFDQNTVIMEDILIGYLKIIHSILEYYKSLKRLIGNEMKFIKKLLEFFTFKEYKKAQIDTIKERCLDEEEKVSFFLVDRTKIPIQQKSFVSSELRQNIYHLLVNLTSDLDNLSLLFNTVFKDIPEQITRITKKSYNPHAEKRSNLNYVGIKNLGCICYMNSMLQQFFCIPSFRYCLLQVNDNKSPQYLEGKLDIDDNVLHQLQKMFTFLELSERQDYNPHEFCHSFKDISGKPTNLTIQQDSQEFLNRLFDVLEKQTKNSQFKYLLESVFGGKTCSQLICSGGCGTVKNSIEAFYNLSLEVKNMKTLKDSLDKFISDESISDYKCEACKKNVTITKRNSIAELPNVLIVHLQRIGFNYDTFQNDKVNSRLEFPKHLDLKNYTSEQICKRENKVNDEESKDSNTESKGEESFPFYIKEDSYYEYELVGVVVHTGTADAGHYYSYINVNREGKDEEMILVKRNNEDVGKWVEFNDSMIRSFSINNLEEECYGGVQHNISNYTAIEGPENTGWESRPSQYEEKENIKSAYMLLYERKKKKPIKLVVDPKIDERINEKNLIKINKTNRYSVPKSFDIFNPELNNEDEVTMKGVYENIFYDEDLEEHFYYKMFYGTNKFLPHIYFDDVYLDNINFYNDQRIFHKDFNEFLNGILDNIINLLSVQSIDIGFLFKVYEICIKFLLEVFSRTYYRENLSKIIKNLCIIVEKLPEYSYFIVEQFVQNKSKLGEFLFSSDEQSSSSFKDFILLCVNLIFKLKSSEIETEIKHSLNTFTIIESEKNIYTQPVFVLLDYLISWFPKELSKNWTKFCPFLEFIDQFANSGELQLEFLFKNEMIFLLVDFFLQKDSPFYKSSDNRVEMGSNTINPKFSALMSTVSTLVCRCLTHTWTEENKESNVIPSTFKGGNVYRMTNKEFECIFSKHFYIKALKGAYNSSAIGSIISHLMYNNLEFTKKILYIVCEVFNESLMLTEIKHNMEVFNEILLINDKYSRLRIEWTMGIPQLQIKSSAGCLPVLLKHVGKYSEKMIQFSSPLLSTSNHDSVIDQVIRLSSHTDLLGIIYYLYNLVLKNPIVFNYFDNCPSPICEYKTINDYFLDVIIEELGTNSTFMNSKSNQEIINFMRNIRSIYELKKQEINSSLNNLYMRCNYFLQKITKEFIIFLPFDNLNSKNVHVLNLEYECEVDNLVNSMEFYDEEHKTNTVDIDPGTKQVEIVKNMEEERKHIRDINFAGNQNRGYVNLLEFTCVTEEILNKKMDYSIFENVSNLGYGNTEEEFYRKMSNNSIPGNNLFRYTTDNQNHNSEKQKCLKKLILVNNSSDDYRVKVHFRVKNKTDQNTYVPESEIIIRLKRFSINKCFTFFKHEKSKPWSDIEISTEIEEFHNTNFSEISHNFNIFDEELIAKNVAHHEISQHQPVPALPAPNDTHIPMDAASIPVGSDDIFVDCPHCGMPNQINSNANVFNCSKCQKILFD